MTIEEVDDNGRETTSAVRDRFHGSLGRQASKQLADWELERARGLWCTDHLPSIFGLSRITSPGIQWTSWNLSYDEGLPNPTTDTMTIRPAFEAVTRGRVSCREINKCDCRVPTVLITLTEWRRRLHAAMQEDGLPLLRLGRKLQGHEVRYPILLLVPPPRSLKADSTNLAPSSRSCCPSLPPHTPRSR